QGHEVIGVELSELAVQQFFEENELSPTCHETSSGRHYRADNIEIICGDIFAVEDAVLESCMGAYDRAALVALPVSMRRQYVDEVYGRLSRQYRGLLLTLDYPQEEMD